MSNFYSALRAMWPMLAVMRAIGWFPVERRHDSDILYVTLRRKFFSIIVLSVQIVPAIYVVELAVKAITRMDPEQYIRAYTLLILGIVMLQAIPVLAFLQAARHATFWNNINKLQVHIQSIISEQLKLNLLRIISIVTLAIATAPFVFTMVILPRFLKINWKLGLYFSLGLLNVSLIIGWWIAITTLIGILSQRILDDYKLLCNPSKIKSQASVATAALAKRTLWLQLCQLVMSAGDTMSLALTDVMLNNLAALVYHFYQLFSGQNAYASTYFGTILLAGAANMYVICSWAQYASTKVTKDLLMAIELTKELKVPLNVQRQLLTFLTFTSGRTIPINLCGYIYLQKSLISSIACAVLSNMLVLYQLHIDERKFDIQEIFNFGNIDF